MADILVTYNRDRVAHVWHLTNEVYRLLAIQGAWGNPKYGYHCHWGGVNGDFDTIEDVIRAHGLDLGI